ncbi:MAG: MotA/TolQ/ExbB proton channel family protein [Myxococcota bacterium]|nr:MotA/TolQ/ExbB proton channel family protein [Myxococcota bacterium]
MGFVIAGTVWGERLASLDPLVLIWQASWIVQLVILLLAAASVISWAVIVFKWRELAGAEQDSEAFLEVYHEGDYERAYEAARDCDRGPLPAIFLVVMSEIKRMARYGGADAAEGLDEGQLFTLSRHIAWASAEESMRLESRLSFLATVGSASPFIGLFGTVVGIINSFTGIGASGSASLAIVAPGIAEALIATAIGLLAAIPATIFYNVFVARLRELRQAIDLFEAELEGDLRRRSLKSVPPIAAEA